MRAMDNTAIGMLTANSGYSAQIEENLKAHLHKKLNKIEMGCMSKALPLTVIHGVGMSYYLLVLT